MRDGFMEAVEFQPPSDVICHYYLSLNTFLCYQKAYTCLHLIYALCKTKAFTLQRHYCLV